MQSALAARHPAPTRRVDIYAPIHKALRAFMCDTLVALGSLDGDDRKALSAGTAQVRLLAAFCASHLRHENDFVHPAMEARRPGSSQAIAADHRHHEQALERLLALCDAAEQGAQSERHDALAELYRYLALFVGENLTHMHVEESEHNAALQSAYSDQELLGIEQAIVASLAPDEAMLGMRWMIPAMNASERAGKLAGIRMHAPAPVFDGVLALARAQLPEREWRKLAQALELEEPLAA